MVSTSPVWTLENVLITTALLLILIRSDNIDVNCIYHPRDRVVENVFCIIKNKMCIYDEKILRVEGRWATVLTNPGGGIRF